MGKQGNNFHQKPKDTLIMSTGWITQVASIPEVPPLTKGFTVGHTTLVLGFFSSPIIKIPKLECESSRGREEKRREQWPPKSTLLFCLGGKVEGDIREETLPTS